MDRLHHRPLCTRPCPPPTVAKMSKLLAWRDGKLAAAAAPVGLPFDASVLNARDSCADGYEQLFSWKDQWERVNKQAVIPEGTAQVMQESSKQPPFVRQRTLSMQVGETVGTVLPGLPTQQFPAWRTCPRAKDSEGEWSGRNGGGQLVERRLPTNDEGGGGVGASVDPGRLPRCGWGPKRQASSSPAQLPPCLPACRLPLQPTLLLKSPLGFRRALAFTMPDNEWCELAKAFGSETSQFDTLVLKFDGQQMKPVMVAAAAAAAAAAGSGGENAASQPAASGAEPDSSAAAPAAEAAPAAAEEKRFDPNCPEGKNYDKAQFLAAYGAERGAAHWDACANEELPEKKRSAPAAAAAEPRRGGRARKKASLGDDHVTEPDRASMNTKIKR